MKRLATYLINSNEFTKKEKIDLSARLADYRRRQTERSAISILSDMKVGQQYTCTELAKGKGSYQLISACLRPLVHLGVVTRTVIKTGRVFEIPNPERRPYEIGLLRAKEEYNCDPNFNTLWYVNELETKLSSLPETITVEEKITYFTRNF